MPPGRRRSARADAVPAQMQCSGTPPWGTHHAPVKATASGSPLSSRLRGLRPRVVSAQNVTERGGVSDRSAGASRPSPAEAKVSGPGCPGAVPRPVCVGHERLSWGVAPSSMARPVIRDLGPVQPAEWLTYRELYVDASGRNEHQSEARLHCPRGRRGRGAWTPRRKNAPDSGARG